MNFYLVAATVAAVIVALVHSVLGELMIFRKLRTDSIVPSQSAPPLEARNVRILWATWHLASALGLGFAAILWTLADPRSAAFLPLVQLPIVFSFLGCAGLVLVATRGRHPGWIGLSVVALLTFFAHPN